MECTQLLHPNINSRMKHLIAILGIALLTSSSFAQKGKGVVHATSKDSLATTVQRIADINKYESQYVGFAGSYSEQYKNFDRLLRCVTEQDLILLVKNKNPAVRVYSFKALITKNKKLAASIYEVLQSDDAPIFTLEGCIGGQATVSSLVRRFMDQARASD